MENKTFDFIAIDFETANSSMGVLVQWVLLLFLIMKL